MLSCVSLIGFGLRAQFDIAIGLVTTEPLAQGLVCFREMNNSKLHSP